MDNSSATGTASHTPSTFQNNGNIRIEPTTNTKVLRNDIIADIFPLESDVNKAEANMLNPIKIQLIEKTTKPCLASSNTGLSGRTKTPTRVGANTTERIYIMIELINMK